MNKAQANQIAAEMMAGLQAVAAKHGLTVKVKGGTFGNGTFTPKVEFAEAGAAEADFVRYAPSFGLQASTFGKKFTYAGKTYTVTGLNLSARKRPVQVVSMGGKTYMFPAAIVAQNVTN